MRRKISSTKNRSPLWCSKLSSYDQIFRSTGTNQITIRCSMIWPCLDNAEAHPRISSATPENKGPRHPRWQRRHHIEIFEDFWWTKSGEAVDMNMYGNVSKYPNNFLVSSISITQHFLTHLLQNFWIISFPCDSLKNSIFSRFFQQGSPTNPTNGSDFEAPWWDWSVSPECNYPAHPQKVDQLKNQLIQETSKKHWKYNVNFHIRLVQQGTHSNNNAHEKKNSEWS